jgi:DNA-binding response OmpR family regulator
MEKTVLVVDDDQDIVRLITESLKFEQFNAIPAYSGKAALSILNEKKVDFIVLDIMMPQVYFAIEKCRKMQRKVQRFVTQITSLYFLLDNAFVNR